MAPRGQAQRRHSVADVRLRGNRLQPTSHAGSEFTPFGGGGRDQNPEEGKVLAQHKEDSDPSSLWLRKILAPGVEWGIDLVCFSISSWLSSKCDVLSLMSEPLRLGTPCTCLWPQREVMGPSQTAGTVAGCGRFPQNTGGCLSPTTAPLRDSS